MPTRFIDAQDWGTYLSEFSQRHQGATVTVHTVDPSGQRAMVHSKPFVSISLETGDTPAVLLVVGQGEEHRIASVKGVVHKDGTAPYSNEVNREEELEITSHETPPITMITFRHDAAADKAHLELNPNAEQY